MPAIRAVLNFLLHVYVCNKYLVTFIHICRLISNFTNNHDSIHEILDYFIHHIKYKNRKMFCDKCSNTYMKQCTPNIYGDYMRRINN